MILMFVGIMLSYRSERVQFATVAMKRTFSQLSLFKGFGLLKGLSEVKRSALYRKYSMLIGGLDDT